MNKVTCTNCGKKVTSDKLGKEKCKCGANSWRIDGLAEKLQKATDRVFNK